MKFFLNILSIFLLLILSGCYVAENNVAPITDWLQLTGAQNISVSTDSTYQYALAPLLQETAVKALMESRQFAKVIDHHSEIAPFQATLAYSWSRLPSKNQDLKELVAGFSLSTIPVCIQSTNVVLSVKFENRLTGESLSVSKSESTNLWFGIIFLPFAWGSEQRAYRDIFYRLTLAAIQEARQKGFFETTAGSNEGFF